MKKKDHRMQFSGYTVFRVLFCKKSRKIFDMIVERSSCKGSAKAKGFPETCEFSCNLPCHFGHSVH